MIQKNKINIEDLGKLLDNPTEIPIEKIPPPEGVSPEIVKAVKNPPIDNKFYSYRELAERIKLLPKVPRITTGFEDFDQQLDGGIEPGELMILSGPPKMGKTTMAQTMSFLQAQKGTPVAWFTLEMSWLELTRKFLAMDGISVEGEASQIWKNGQRATSDLPLWYPIDNRALSLEWMENQIVKAKREFDAKIIYIDHLHFLVPLADSRSNVSFIVGGIVREIKQIARRQNIPIVLIAHTKKIDAHISPDYNSLRDSSFLAQESDFTVMIWRVRADSGSKKKNWSGSSEEEEGDDEDQAVYTDKTILSLELNRRNGNTRKMKLGMLNGRFHSWRDYEALKESGSRSEQRYQDTTLKAALELFPGSVIVDSNASRGSNEEGISV